MVVCNKVVLPFTVTLKLAVKGLKVSVIVAGMRERITLFCPSCSKISAADTAVLPYSFSYDTFKGVTKDQSQSQSSKTK